MNSLMGIFVSLAFILSTSAQAVELKGKDAKELYGLLKSIGASIKPFIESTEIEVTNVSCVKGHFGGRKRAAQTGHEYYACSLADGERTLWAGVEDSKKLWDAFVEDANLKPTPSKDTPNQKTVGADKITCDSGYNIGSHSLFHVCTIES